jgi:hypothetical protein
MAYHPQTDGTTKQVNQEIEAYLSIYCSAHSTEWKSSLSTLEFTHNNWWHADQTHTSFELINGKASVAIPMTFENTKFPSVAEKIKNLVTSREEALAAHELAWSCIVERIKLNLVPFKKGQMVWLDLRHLKTNYYKKMAPKREGLFEIKEVLGLANWNSQNFGKSTKSSMPHCSMLIEEMRSMERTVSDHRQT